MGHRMGDTGRSTAQVKVINMHRSRHSWWIVILGISAILGAYGVYLDRQTTSPAQANTVNPNPDTSSSEQPVVIVYRTLDPRAAIEQDAVVNRAASRWSGQVNFVKVDPKTANNREHLAALGPDSSKTTFVVLQGGRPLNRHTGFLDEVHINAFIREAGVSEPPTSIPNPPVMR
jgi:hypothetical protein